MKLDWTKYFDAIWCISYLPYKTRKELMTKQLDRVGILDHPNFNWNITFDSPYYEYLFNQLKTTNKLSYISKLSEVKCALGHYSCIKKSQNQGYNKILILQDDVRFLKDLNQIELILNNRPENVDVIMFDKTLDPKMVNIFFSETNRNKINEHYAKRTDKLILWATRMLYAK